MIVHRTGLCLAFVLAIQLWAIHGCSRQPGDTSTPADQARKTESHETPLQTPAATAPPPVTNTGESKRSQAQTPNANPPKAAPGTTTRAGTRPPPATLDLSLSADHEAKMFDENFNVRGQQPYGTLFDFKARKRERKFSVSGDLFWDEEKLKQEKVDYMDALKGGEISIEVKTP